jgi:glycosyltransferase involved in cell wall biosynthesis
MKRKIGLVLISNGFAGTERVVFNLMNKFDDGVYLFVNKEIIGYYKNFNKKVIGLGKIYHKIRFIKYLYFLKARKKLKELIKEKGINLVVLFLFHSFVISYGQSIKTLVSLRGTEVVEYLSRGKKLKDKFLKNFFNKIFDSSNKIISVSKNQIKNFPEKYKQKLIIIPNGIDSKLFKPLKNIKQKNNVILFVGRIIKDKGVNEILSVAKKLPQYEFWFAGKGDLENKINLPNTKFLGSKNSEELVKLYNQATICILPSYHEGFSNVGLETISCGRAFICTPDFSEYIENGKDGIIIPAKDEVALKNAIVDLMTNEKKRKMLEKNARKKALKYSWDNVAKKYIEVFT